MTKFLNPPEIDFLQGRLSTSVFMKNYSNPVLIKDLRRRVFPGISEMQVTLSKTLSTILFGFQKPYTPQGLRFSARAKKVASSPHESQTLRLNTHSLHIRSHFQRVLQSV